MPSKAKSEPRKFFQNLTTEFQVSVLISVRVLNETRLEDSVAKE